MKLAWKSVIKAGNLITTTHTHGNITQLSHPRATVRQYPAEHQSSEDSRLRHLKPTNNHHALQQSPLYREITMRTFASWLHIIYLLYKFPHSSSSITCTDTFSVFVSFFHLLLGHQYLPFLHLSQSVSSLLEILSNNFSFFYYLILTIIIRTSIFHSNRYFGSIIVNQCQFSYTIQKQWVLTNLIFPL